MNGGVDPDLGFRLQERRRQRRLALVIAVLVLVPLGLLAAREVQVGFAKRDALLSPARRAELKELLDRREVLGQQRVARWNEASRRELLAGSTLATLACPLSLKPPSQFSAGAYVKFATHDENFGAWSLCILRSEGSCATVYRAPADLTMLRARLADGELYSWDLEEAKAAPADPDPPRAVVVVDSEVPPTIQSSLVGRFSFVPGSLSGHAFLFAPELGRFICGGQVSVRNSKSVEIEYSHFGDDPAQQQAQAEEEGRAALARDLEVHLRFALPEGLRRLEPADAGQ